MNEFTEADALRVRKAYEEATIDSSEDLEEAVTKTLAHANQTTISGILTLVQTYISESSYSESVTDVNEAVENTLIALKKRAPFEAIQLIVAYKHTSDIRESAATLKSAVCSTLEYMLNYNVDIDSVIRHIHRIKPLLAEKQKQDYADKADELRAKYSGLKLAWELLKNGYASRAGIIVDAAQISEIVAKKAD